MTLFKILIFYSIFTGQVQVPQEEGAVIYIPDPKYAPEIYSGCTDDGSEYNYKSCWYTL